MKIDVKTILPNSIVVVRTDSHVKWDTFANSCQDMFQGIEHNFGIVHLGTDSSIEIISEEDMNKMGWFRKP